MPHVTFIHGIANKPPATDLLRIWREALANASDPLPLGDLGVTSELVYWADLMYEKPDEMSLPTRACSKTRPRRSTAAAAPPRCRKPQRRPSFSSGCESELTALSDTEIASRRRLFRRTRRARSSGSHCRGSSRSAS